MSKPPDNYGELEKKIENLGDCYLHNLDESNLLPHFDYLVTYSLESVCDNYTKLEAQLGRYQLGPLHRFIQDEELRYKRSIKIYELIRGNLPIALLSNSSFVSLSSSC